MGVNRISTEHAVQGAATEDLRVRLDRRLAEAMPVAVDWNLRIELQAQLPAPPPVDPFRPRT